MLSGYLGTLAPLWEEVEQREGVKGAKGRAAPDLEKLAVVDGNSMKICLLQVWREPSGRSSAALGPYRRGAGGARSPRVEDKLDQCWWCALSCSLGTRPAWGRM